MTATRQVTWGQALMVEVAGIPGGMQAISKAIDRELGAAHVGTRNTFAKLFKVADPASLNDVDRWRAWLVLTAAGLDPADWGITDGAVPKYIDADALKQNLVLVHRRGLEPRTRWFRAFAGKVPGEPNRRDPQPRIVPPSVFPTSISAPSNRCEVEATAA